MRRCASSFPPLGRARDRVSRILQRCASPSALEYDGRAFCGFQSQPSRLRRAGRARGGARRHRRAPRRRDRRRAHRRRRARRARRSCTSTPTRAARSPRGCAASMRICRRRRPCSGRSPLPIDFHARFAATRAPLHLPAAEPPRAARRSTRAASAGTIGRSTSTRCSAAAAVPGRRARLLVVSRGGVPGEVAGEDAALASTSTRHGDLVRFDFSANAFLHHMIRNLVGALVLRRRGKARRRSGWRSSSRPRPHARARRRSPPTACISPGRITTRGSGCRRRCARSRRSPADASQHEAIMSRTRVKICGITRVADGVARRARRGRRRDRPRVLGRHAALRRRRAARGRSPTRCRRSCRRWRCS